MPNKVCLSLVVMSLFLGGCANFQEQLDVALYGSVEEGQRVHEKYSVQQTERDLEKMEKMERELLALIQEERKKNKLFPHNPNEGTQIVARMRARELTEKYGEIRPDDRHYSTIFSEVSELDRLKPKPARELRARGLSSPESVLKQWMQDSKARKVILGSALRGYAVGVAKKDGSYYWVFVSFV